MICYTVNPYLHSYRGNGMKKILLFLVVICFTLGCKSAGGNDQKDNIEQPKKDYSNAKIGDKGKGGGIIFHIDGEDIMEVSENLGKENWEGAKTLCENYLGGGYDNWYLPSKKELNWVWTALIKTKKIRDNHLYWSATEEGKYPCYQNFGTGSQGYGRVYEKIDVRAVRGFKASGN